MDKEIKAILELEGQLEAFVLGSWHKEFTEEIDLPYELPVLWRGHYRWLFNWKPTIKGKLVILPISEEENTVMVQIFGVFTGGKEKMLLEEVLQVGIEKEFKVTWMVAKYIPISAKAKIYVDIVEEIEEDL